MIGRRFAERAPVYVAMLALVAPPAVAGPYPTAPIGKSYFFATREACAASGMFNRQECAWAFMNALAELRDRAPRFASVTECRLRFSLCEAIRDNGGYGPVGLGVEIVSSARGARVMPAMAVETPRSLFPPVPIRQEYVGRDVGQRVAGEVEGAILPADRFQPFSKRARITAQFSFNYAALGQVEGAPPPGSAPQETLQERRARLRAAPFVE